MVFGPIIRVIKPTELRSQRSFVGKRQPPRCVLPSGKNPGREEDDVRAPRDVPGQQTKRLSFPRGGTIAHQDDLPRVLHSRGKRPGLDAGRAEPLGQVRVVAPENDFGLHRRHLGRIGHVELGLTAGRRGVLLERRQEAVFARGAVDDDVLGKNRDRELRFRLALGIGDGDRDPSVEDANAARPHDLQPGRILTRHQYVFVGQHGFQAGLAPAIDLDRFDEQAPAQRVEGVEHRVDRAGLQFAEDRRGDALARKPLVLRARDAVADHVRIGPQRAGAQFAQVSHPGQALAEIVVGIGERIGQLPTVPVGHELIEELAVQDGVLAGRLADLLEVASHAHEVDGAAHAVFGDE